MANIALIFLFSTLLVALVSGQDCPANQVYDKCDTACPDYCNGAPARVCTFQCVPRCRCADGYVKKAINSDECILATQCNEVQQRNGLKEMQCPKNQQIYSCGTSCPKYCGQPVDVPCPAVCLMNVCQCKPGYALISKDSDECIPQTACP